MVEATPKFIFEGKRMKECIKEFSKICTILTIEDDQKMRRKLIQELLIPMFSKQRAIVGYELMKNAKNPEVKKWFEEISEEIESEDD